MDNISKSKVIKIIDDVMYFDSGITLSASHDQDCCETHYLSMDDLTIDDFDGLEFDLLDENFFRRIEDYGIELIPAKGHSVKIPGYGSNNGYYSSDLSLVLTNGSDFNVNYDISECQDIDWG